jgi:hypothetical protein
LVAVTDSFEPEWDVLAAVSAARDELRAIRSEVWSRALLSSKEVLHVDRVRVDGRGWSPDPTGDVVVTEAAIVTTMPDGHDIDSVVTLLLSRDRWQVQSEVTVLNDAVTVVWEGPIASGTVRTDLAPALLAAARQIVASTLALDALAAPTTK